MTDQNDTGAGALPTEEQIAAAKTVATSLIALSVAELVSRLTAGDIDLLSLRFTLDAEEAKGTTARKSAIAAIGAAIDGHPEQVAALAAAADQAGDQDDETEEEPAEGDAAADADADADTGAGALPTEEATPVYVDSPDGFFAMNHPEGGSTDAWQADEHGNVLVPYADVDVARSHGFVLSTVAAPAAE